MNILAPGAGTDEISMKQNSIGFAFTRRLR
jgi:hypothetical protein